MTGNLSQSSGSVGLGIHSNNYIMNTATPSDSTPSRSLGREHVPQVFFFIGFLHVNGIY